MGDVTKLARSIRLLILDVDGVLTDGRLHFSSGGDEIKTFSVRDGHGIRRLQAAGAAVAVISGRKSSAVDRRMDELGVRHVFQGCGDKVAVLAALIKELDIGLDQCAYMGDDLPDLDVMKTVALPMCVADADPALLKTALWQSQARGGAGAVREACDMLIASRGEHE